MNISWDTAIDDNKDRVEIYIYQKKEDFDNFVKEPSDNQALRNCFDKSEYDLNRSCNK